MFSTAYVLTIGSDYDFSLLVDDLSKCSNSNFSLAPSLLGKKRYKAVSFATRTQLLFLVVVFDQESKARQKRFFQPLFLRKTLGQYGLLKAKEIKLGAQPLMASRHGYRWRASPTKAALHLRGPRLGLA